MYSYLYLIKNFKNFFELNVFFYFLASQGAGQGKFLFAF